MKKIVTTLAVSLCSQLVFAHGVHPLVADYAKTLEMAYEQALHKANYEESKFDNLIGLSSTQDTTKKVRTVKFKFTDCNDDLEIYLKLDGSAYLANKVVKCTP